MGAEVYTVQIDLSESSVLVTGASRGIGAAITRQLVRSGARVAAHYHHNGDGAKRAIAGCLRGSLTLCADLGEPDAPARLFAEAVERLGRVDVLVNNGAVAIESPLEQPLEEWREAWDRTQAVNLRAAAILSREAVNHFRGRGGGRIVNVASRAAFRGDTLDYLAYAASKGGMVALSRSIARGAGKYGVTSFVVAPGFTRTDMAQPFMDRYGEDVAMEGNVLGRLTEPGDIAPVVVFLASGLADHATGTTIDVNAGSYVR